MTTAGRPAGAAGDVDSVGQRVVGLYLEAEIVHRDPAYLDALRDDVGLNLVSTGGRVSLPETLLARNPLGTDDREQRLAALSARGLDGSPVVGEGEKGGPTVSTYPGLEEVGDDTVLRDAIAQCRQRGLTTWITLTGWTTRLSMLCPSKAAVNDWYVAAFGQIAKQYAVDGINVTRIRYPMFGVPHGVGFCTCPDCAATARELGYDFEQILTAVRRIPARVRGLSAQSIARLAASNPGVFDLTEIIPELPSALQWLNLRADILTRQLQKISKGLKAAAGRPLTFGGDIHPPGVALLVGQRYSDVPSYADWTGPILSHGETFGNRGFAFWAALLRDAVSGLDEASALQLVYRLTGYDGLGYPSTIDELGVGKPDGEFRDVPLVASISRDLDKARIFASRRIPSYPIVRGGHWPDAAVRAIARHAEEVGHDGIIYQGTEALTGYKPK